MLIKKILFFTFFIWQITGSISFASTKTAEILNRFNHAILNQQFLVGQNIGHANQPEKIIQSNHHEYFDKLQNQTGQSPAILAMDYGWETFPEQFTHSNALLTRHWNKGGLIEISLHPKNPFTNGSMRDLTTGPFTYQDLFNDGSVVNTRFKAMLDELANGLLDLQSRGVIVLFRPFHEMNGDFFWWSYSDHGRVSAGEFKQLWQYTYTYLTNIKKLDNLIWIYSPIAVLWENGTRDVAYYYPGPAWVDMVAMDYYFDDFSKLNYNGNYDRLVSFGKPLGLAEVGPSSAKGFDNRLVLEAIKQYPKISFAIYWHGWTQFKFFKTHRAIIEQANYKIFMTDPAVIGLQRLPALSTYKK